MEYRSEMESKPKHEDISTTITEIEYKQTRLENEVNAILDTPAPAPKKDCCEDQNCKEEEKKDETAAPAEGETNAEA